MNRRHLLFLFLDGVGLGQPDPATNPFCVARMPTLSGLLGDNWYLSGPGAITSDRASLIPTDACLGVPGRPQSATGQATLLTGRNVPVEIGRHYGPKPNRDIAAILSNGNLFSAVRSAVGPAVFLNPYPPAFFDAIASGRRLLSAIPLAARAAGLRLMTHSDLVSGRAVSPDFSGRGWRERLGFHDTPLLSLQEAGHTLARLAQSHSLTFFEHWPSDLVGHRRDFQGAVEMFERFDSVLAGLLDSWDWGCGMILITSDHGNVEDLAVRTHTLNPVPTILIGGHHAELAAQVSDLTDLAPLVDDFLTGRGYRG
jgi:hypothetical protein